jgi:hypothetical protein
MFNLLRDERCDVPLDAEAQGAPGLVGGDDEDEDESDSEAGEEAKGEEAKAKSKGEGDGMDDGADEAEEKAEESAEEAEKKAQEKRSRAEARRQRKLELNAAGLAVAPRTSLLEVITTRTRDAHVHVKARVRS